jgi:hypothetical protein
VTVFSRHLDFAPPRGLACAACWLALALLAANAQAQPTIQFPQGGSPAPAQGGTLFGQPGNFVPAPPAASVPPTLNFDPYAAPRTIPTPNPGLLNPATPGYGPAPVTGGSTAPFAANQGPNMGWGSAPAAPVSPTWPGAAPVTPYGGPAYANPYGWSGPPPGQTIYPNGWAWGQGQQPIPLFQNIGLRHTWIYGKGDPTDLQTHDSEASFTMAAPNFLFTQQPIYITPGFVLHLWDGPKGLVADLPSKAYSAYLDLQYRTDPNFQVGAEVDARVGLYSDFRTLTDDSIRITGVGLGVIRVSPELAVKFGVAYLDRNRYKLLPAGGIFWYPTPQIKLDLFFPSPKLAMYLTTAGPLEIWGYIGAEYGGGAWTVQRTAGFTDRIDINDYRVFAGLESTGVRGLHSFIEAGYVFGREVTYYSDPAQNFDPPNTFMLRGGVSF